MTFLRSLRQTAFLLPEPGGVAGFRALTQRFVFAGTLLLVFLLPLPLGSNRIWAWSVEAMAVSLLLLALVVAADTEQWRAFGRKTRAIAPLVWLMLAWLAWNVLFVLPLPAGWVEILAPAVARQAAGSGVSPTGLSLDRHASMLFLLQSVFYVLFFVLIYWQIDSIRRVVALWWAIFLAALVQAIYGLWLVSIGSRGLFYGFYEVSAGNLAGSFVNRNHAVAFLSLGLLTGLALRWHWRQRREQSLSHQAAWHRKVSMGLRLARFASSPLRVLDLALLVLVAALASTHSRAGILSAVGAAAFFLACLRAVAARRADRRTHKWRQQWVAGLLLAVVVLVFAGREIGATVQRLDGHGVPLGGERGLAWQQGWQYGQQYWPWGVGGGAYQNFFVLHRQPGQSHFFDHAHSDYLEFMLENGLGSLLMFGLLIWLIHRAWQACRLARSSRVRLGAVLALAMLIYFLLHGTVDFNARIPANVLVAIALAAAFLAVYKPMPDTPAGLSDINGKKNVTN